MKTLLKPILFLSLLLTASLCHASYTVLQDQMHEPIKSPNLQNVERLKIKLSNGLEAYLVSDPGATKSGAALSVGVGWNHEPFEHIGVAHFVEHMLFMGTEKYPIEKEYSEFITSNGGISNAYTTSDRTVYAFEVNNEQVIEALDRFSSFFVSPLFNESGLERERKAVNQEFLYRANLDDIRTHLVATSLLDENSHASIWRCGTEETLKNVSRDQIMDWYQSHYSANLMKLSVYSSLPMDQLLEQVSQIFAQIENKNFQFATLTYPVSKQENLGKMVYIEPLHDIKHLIIKWELPPEFSHDLTYHTADLVSYVLAEESPMSLATVLKEEGYIHALYGGQSQSDTVVSDFKIYVQLTEKGLQHKEEVIAKCYEAIHSFQEAGIPRYRFDEMVTLAKLEYNYQSRPSAYQFVESNAAGMQYEALSTFPQQSCWPSTYSSERVVQFLSCLNADQATYFVVAPGENVGHSFDLQERFTGAKYSIDGIAKNTLVAWENEEPTLEIAIAQPNAFIPNNLDVITTSKDFGVSKDPTIFQENKKSCFYYAADQDYGLPEASYTVMIASPAINEEAESKVLADFYNLSLSDALLQHMEQGALAGLNAQTAMSSKYGLTLKVSGYSQKAQLFFNKITAEANGHAPKAKDFDKYHDRLLRSYNNQKKQIPGVQAGESMKNLLIKDYASIDNRIAVLQNMTFDRLQTYCQTLFEQVYIRSMIYGNVTQSQAKAFAASICKTFAYSKPYPVDEQYKRAILELGDSSAPKFYDEETTQEGNATFLMVSHGALNSSERVAYDVLSKAISTPFFETLRTKQQVGYIVQTFPREYDKKYFSCFIVQSNSCSTRDLLARYELFNEQFLSSLGTEDFSETKFDVIRQALITDYLQPSNSIIEKATELQALAFEHQGNFQLSEDRAEALRNLSFDEFTNFCHRDLGKENSRRIAVLINGKMSEIPTLTYQPILDVTNFKAESFYRPDEKMDYIRGNGLNEKVQ